ncbi:branched-chain amino acid transporter permease [Helicobacter baculiformis]|uniref:Branched-chain amino acid transporter permease n=1 Tax=Helicobacter baculiformis TaxID=427351 RepID=A0ABV7ZH83_9HELI|nr:AzlD domain-containing protein [Helicobacter baculiformis]
MSDLYVWLVLIMTAMTTYFIRVFPFLLFNAKRPAPNILLYLGRVLSLGVVGMLIVYSLKDTPFSSPPYGLNEMLAVSCVVVSHLILRVFVLSVVGGTALYMWLVQSAILNKFF